jgi:predicted dehydrogenase
MRVALIGSGVGANLHAPAIRAYRGAEIVGVAGLDEKLLAEFGERHGVAAMFFAVFGSRHGVAARFTDYREMIEATRPRVVHVVTPPRTHAAIAKQALELGCAVMVDKPMCMNVQEAEELIAASRASGRPLCVMHNHRFDPPILKAEELLRSVADNEPFLVRVTYFRERFRLEEEGNLDPAHWLHELPLGVYGEHGAPHVIYLILHWLGRADEVSITEKRVHAGSGREMRLWNATLCSGNQMGVMALGSNTAQGFFVVELFTPQMVLRLNMLDLTYTVYRERELGVVAGRMGASVEESLVRLWSTTSNVAKIVTGRLKRRPGHRTLVKAFYDSIRDGVPPPVPPEEGLETVRVMCRIEELLGLGTRTGTS